MRSGTISAFLQNAMLAANVTLLILWGAGQILRDGSWISGLMFYIPSSVLGAWYLLLAIVAWKTQSGRHLHYTSLMLPPTLFVMFVENQWFANARSANTSPAETAAEMRLVHWNICHGVGGWPGQLEIIRSLNPDVIVLSEVSEEIQDADFPGFQTLQLRGMLIASRGTMVASRTLVAGGALHAFQVRCDLEDGPLNVIIADMTSNIYVGRDPYLQSLVRVMEGRNADIVVGDFNAPRRSRALSNLPAGYRHAYDEAGSGWSSTWPVPFPVFAIDQCLCGPKIRPLSYTLYSTMLSDHRIQVLDFEKK
jgi:endonuclease/exonuclease/phosphatase (EEP) superfamily protein YafD